MITCAVYGCSNSLATNPDPGVQYYYFPKHPVFAQQWLTACWRADPVDVDNAQICSIHFDNNSYSSEYKVLDYLGHYTRLLKYDAVPTLYLPNIPEQVILKNSQQPLTINIANTINQNEIKNLVIYDIQDVTFDTNNSKNFIQIHPSLKLNEDQALTPINTVQLDIRIPVNDTHIEEDEKYKCIQNVEQLNSLKNENVILQQNIQTVKDNITRLESLLSKRNEAAKTKDEMLQGLLNEHDTLRRVCMTYSVQKNILSKVFSESQLKILSGRKKIYWSNDDMAAGYTIWNLSNKRCYMYLMKNLKIPLPGLSSIRRWATLKRHEATKGANKSEDEASN